MKRTLPLLTSLLLAGCVEYQSAPIDWEAEVAGLGKEPSAVSFSLEDVRLRALAFSPGLNALRLAHATSEAKAAAAGYWDDPSLNLDVLRVLKEPENPWIAGGSMSFTLPITGIPGLERRVAEAYSEADKWDVIAAEFATAAEAVTLAQTAQALQNLIAFLERDLRAAGHPPGWGLGLLAGAQSFSSVIPIGDSFFRIQFIPSLTSPFRSSSGWPFRHAA